MRRARPRYRKPGELQWSDNEHCQNQDPEPDTATAVRPNASESLPAGVADNRISSEAGISTRLASPQRLSSCRGPSATALLRGSRMYFSCACGAPAPSRRMVHRRPTGGWIGGSSLCSSGRCVVRWSFVGMVASDEVAATQAPGGCREDGECPGDHDRERGPGRQGPVGAAEDAARSAGEREEATDFRDRLEDGGLNRRGDDDEPDDGDDLVAYRARRRRRRGGRAGQRRPGCATARRRCRRRPALLARGLTGPARRR